VKQLQAALQICAEAARQLGFSARVVKTAA
jgi:hypothetical protein